ncbi:DUF2637 domain-containing protein [Micromonospora sp. DT4]|uniref:DUF2637 domain-containing protein n=1 Tax=Micromonospora sp. DT4 TaxID=3393438 RepID=UPI003CF8EAB1
MRAVLALGVAASIAANVLHARPNLISQVIAAWPPLALLLTVELISRVPADRRGLAAARLIAAAGIAGIAAWVSYWHMVGVAARYGETDAAASYLLPISVDGLVVVASISLVEIAGQIRTPSVNPAGGQQPATMPAETLTSTGEPPERETWVPVSGPVDAAHPDGGYDVPPTPEAGNRGDEGRHPAWQVARYPLTSASGKEEVAPEPRPVEAPGQKDAHHLRPGDDALVPGDTTLLQGTDLSHLDADRPGGSKPRTTGHQAAPTEDSHERDTAHPPADAHDAEIDKISRPVDGKSNAEVPSDTAGAVAYWYRQDPSLHPADIATRIGRSERTVRRYWPRAPRTAKRHDTSRSAEHVGTL